MQSKGCLYSWNSSTNVGSTRVRFAHSFIDSWKKLVLHYKRVDPQWITTALYRTIRFGSPQIRVGQRKIEVAGLYHKYTKTCLGQSTGSVNGDLLSWKKFLPGRFLCVSGIQDFVPKRLRLIFAVFPFHYQTFKVLFLDELKSLARLDPHISRIQPKTTYAGWRSA